METVDGVCIHHVSAKNIEPLLPFDTATILKIFKKYKVSVHLLIERDGTQVQLVPEGRKAYHAGKSRFKGRDNCNNFLLGVELVGGVDWPFTDDQMFSLGEYLAQQMTKHQFTLDWITGHNVIRDNWNEKYPDKKASKKVDPSDYFNWEILNDMLYSVSETVKRDKL